MINCFRCSIISCFEDDDWTWGWLIFILDKLLMLFVAVDEDGKIGCKGAGLLRDRVCGFSSNDTLLFTFIFGIFSSNRALLLGIVEVDGMIVFMTAEEGVDALLGLVVVKSIIDWD